MTDELREIERRLAAVERRNRLLAAALVLVFGGGLLLAAGPGADPPAPLVRAERFQLVDGAGTVRAELRLDEGAPVFSLLDEAGVERLSLSHGADATALYIRDASGTTRLGAAQFAHGGGGFALHGPESKGAAVLYLKDRGSLSFYDAQGTVTLRLPEPPG